MSELRTEAINLIEKMPEEYLLAIVQYARRFENKSFADEQAMFAEWNNDPDTYEDKIAEYVNKIVKADRYWMKILIDTNIIISGLFFYGLPKEFLIKMDFKKFQVCVNKEIITEYKEQIQKKSN